MIRGKNKWAENISVGGAQSRLALREREALRLRERLRSFPLRSAGLGLRLSLPLRPVAGLGLRLRCSSFFTSPLPLRPAGDAVRL